MSRFDESLNDRWKNDYANNDFTTDHSNIIGNDDTNDVCINVQDDQPQRRILSEAQKYKKALKIAQALASVASEGGLNLGRLGNLRPNYSICMSFKQKRSTLE